MSMDAKTEKKWPLPKAKKSLKKIELVSEKDKKCPQGG